MTPPGEWPHVALSSAPIQRSTVRYEVLGELRVRRADRPDAAVPLGGPKQRLVLALLLAAPNEVVSVDRLIDGVWGDAAPDTARHTLQGYISELRKAIGPSIERDGSGYAVHAGMSELDSLELESLTSAGIAQVGPSPAEAVATLDRALALWRGRPYHGFEDCAPLATEIARLEELHLGAVEHRLRALLALGRNTEVVTHLERLTREHPYREELRSLQMLALYRSGRQADALRAYQATRVILNEELGIEPSPALGRLEERILVQDPGLELAVAHPDPELSAVIGPAENPFKGLQPFGEEDRDDFFGRDALCEQVISALRSGTPLVALVGPSGAGKSSALHAGIVPRLRDRDGPDRFLVTTMQPGAHPYAHLEVALQRVGSMSAAMMSQLRDGPTGVLRAASRLVDERTRLVIVVDQLEEVFTSASEDERAAFLAALAVLANEPGSRIQLLVALRADFYDRPLLHDDFADAFTRSVVHVMPLTPDELEAAAVRPLDRQGVGIEPRLVAELVADVRRQPNALPLFQYALTELFDRRNRDTLTLERYQQLGGLRLVVAGRADELYEHLDDAQRDAARQLALRLVTIDGDLEARRRVPASELTSLEVDLVALQSVIEAFTRHRLLFVDRDPSTGAPTIEVAHEALLREWSRLRRWLDEGRADLRVHRALTGAVDEWLAAGRDPEYLLTGGRLAEYERWSQSSTFRLAGLERQYLDASIARREAAEREAAERLSEQARLQRRATRRTWALAASVVTVAAAAAAIVVTNRAEATPTIGLYGFASGSNIDDLVLGGFRQAQVEHGFAAVEMPIAFSDAADQLGQMADTVDLVIVGGLDPQVEDLPQVIADHPHADWIVGEPRRALPGVATFSIAVNEGSYLAGAAAALTSRTGAIGFIGGQQISQLEWFRAGFEAGALAVDAQVRILASYLEPGPYGGWTDPQGAHELATWMFEQGADVVFTAAGLSGEGTFRAAADWDDAGHGQVWGVGVDADEYITAPEALRPYVLTSMVKRYDEVMQRIIDDWYDGGVDPGNRVYGIADGAVGLSHSGNHLSPTVLARLERLRSEVAGGRVEVPNAPSQPLSVPLGLEGEIGAEATVTFDGRTCSYDGPSEVGDATLVHVVFDNRSGTEARVELTDPASYAMIGVSARAGSTNEGHLGLFSDPAGDWQLTFRCFPSATGFDGTITAGDSIIIKN
jgi:basic membrane lipoprotein Med (substrate-binding protein (PBP1-ABC) superfamily)/DNA-binding SARP family transcriptional activator